MQVATPHALAPVRRPILQGVVLAAVVVLGGWLPAQGATVLDELIRGHCLKAIRAEEEVSGLAAPDGMDAYTCDCVVEEFNKGTSIDQAIASCKQAAIEAFGL